METTTTTIIMMMWSKLVHNFMQICWNFQFFVSSILKVSFLTQCFKWNVLLWMALLFINISIHKSTDTLKNFIGITFSLLFSIAVHFRTSSLVSLLSMFECKQSFYQIIIIIIIIDIQCNWVDEIGTFYNGNGGEAPRCSLISINTNVNVWKWMKAKVIKQVGHEYRKHVWGAREILCVFVVPHSVLWYSETRQINFQVSIKRSGSVRANIYI